MPIAKSRLVGIIEIPEVPACNVTQSGFRDDLTLKQAFRRLAASPRRRETATRSRLAPVPATSSATVVYADLGQLCSELKAEAARLQGRFLS